MDLPAEEPNVQWTKQSLTVEDRQLVSELFHCGKIVDGIIF
jgi:hypothetical protein